MKKIVCSFRAKFCNNLFLSGIQVPLSRNTRNAILYVNIFFLYEGNCRQFDVTLARKLSIVTKFLNVIQRNQYRGKIIKRESCGINNFLQDQGSKFPSLWGLGIKILSEKMGSVMKKYTSLLP